MERSASLSLATVVINSRTPPPGVTGWPQRGWRATLPGPRAPSPPPQSPPPPHAHPQWEDPAFKKDDEQHGGKWTFIVKDRKLLDECWLNTVLALIGEQFTDPSEIAGAVVSVRKQQAKLCLWTRTEQNQAVQTTVAMQLKKVLDLGDTDKITYQSFKDELDGERRDLYIV